MMVIDIMSCSKEGGIVGGIMGRLLVDDEGLVLATRSGRQGHCGPHAVPDAVEGAIVIG